MINRTYSLNDVRFLMFIALIDGIILGVLLSGNLAHSQTRITPAEVCKGKTAREQCVCLGMDYDPHLKPVPGCAVKKLPEPKFEIVPFSHTEDGWNIEEYVAPAIRSQDVPAVQKEVRGLTFTIIPCGGPPVDNPLFACIKPDMVLQWVCEDTHSIMLQAQDGKIWCHLPIQEPVEAAPSKESCRVMRGPIERILLLIGRIICESCRHGWTRTKNASCSVKGITLGLSAGRRNEDARAIRRNEITHHSAHAE